MLQRRGQTYTSRIIVPAHLRDTLRRSEITRSLRTQDHREALRRLRLWESHVGHLLKTVSRQGASMTREDLDRLVQQYLRKTFDDIEDTLALDWSRVGLDQYGWSLEERAYALTGALQDADPSPALELAQEMAPGAPEDVLRKLARRLMEAQLHGITATLKALNGEPLISPLPIHALPEAPQAAPQVAPRSSLRVSELARLYGDERVARKNWTARTEVQMRGYLALLADLLDDPYIGDVTKSDMRELGLTLTKLPARMAVIYPGKTPREALEAAGDDEKVPRLAANSVNAYAQAIRSFFLWAMEHDHIAHNPAVVLKNMETGRASDERHPFTDEDLIAYFSKLDAKPGRLDVEYWVPRIMAFTGCRLGEAAQLRKDDVRQEQAIWVIDINEADQGKSLKTRSSRRVVPIHRRLIEIGFLDFVEAAPPGFLWPEDMRTAPNPEVSRVDKLQKRLAHVFRAAITDHKKTAAHSFRHTVSARLKTHSVQDYQVAEILGHELGSMSTGRYGKVTDLTTLKKVIDLLELPI